MCVCVYIPALISVIFQFFFHFLCSPWEEGSVLRVHMVAPLTGSHHRNAVLSHTTTQTFLLPQ